jgi:hypothetical protein
VLREGKWIVPSLDAVEPDLFVIVVDDAAAAENVLHHLAAELFCGSIVLIGSLATLACLQQFGEQLGLVMRPVLGTPFRKAELTERIADLLPTAPPPSLAVDVIEAFGNKWLELWYQPKIDPRALTVCGAEALIRLRHPTWGVVPPALSCPTTKNFESHGGLEALRHRPRADRDRGQSAGCRGCGPWSRPADAPAAAAPPAFDRLIVEIDAGELIGGAVPVREIARELASCGVGISIANLGTECASLTVLEGFPIMELKVAPGHQRLRAGPPEAGSVRHDYQHRTAHRRPHGRQGRGNACRFHRRARDWFRSGSRSHVRQADGGAKIRAHAATTTPHADLTKCC